MPQTHTVTLTKAEERLAEYIARCRYARDRAAGVKDKRIGGESAEKIDLEGCAGEIAAAKWLNLYPDLTTEPREGSCDLVMHNGLRVDVKTRPTIRPDLVTPHWTDPDKADIYLLVNGECPNYTIVGYTASSVLISPERLESGKPWPVPTYVVKRWELQSPELLRPSGVVYP